MSDLCIVQVKEINGNHYVSYQSYVDTLNDCNKSWKEVVDKAQNKNQELIEKCACLEEKLEKEQSKANFEENKANVNLEDVVRQQQMEIEALTTALDVIMGRYARMK